MQSNVSVSDEEKSAIPAQQIGEQVQRVLHSESFKGSEILRNLLEYLASCYLNGRTEAIKVKEIAREVFGRSENFDSQTDSVVRVHTGRLRSKLAEYYLDEGADDDLIIGIPKGSYGLTWHPRRNPLHSPEPLPALSPPEHALPLPAVPHRPSYSAKLILAGLAAMVIILVGAWAATRRGAPENPTVSTPGLATFWRPFIATHEQPLIVFSTFHLGGSLETEVHPLAGDRVLPGEIDTYTTTGEVMGVFEVTRILASFGQGARAKHGQLLTWDDAKDSNLIFVGGPLAHTPLRTLSAMKELEFRKQLPGLPPEAAGIVNIHPREHEQQLYLGPMTRPYGFDYGVIAVKPTFNRNRRTLILAGITEYGTQGAADFVTQEDRVNELLSRLHVRPGEALPSFEALIRVKMQGDVPVQYELALAHLVK